MKPKFRIINYTILFLAYYFGTALVLRMGVLYNAVVTVGLCYMLINIINAFVVVKLKFYWNLLLAIVMTVCCLFIALRIGNLDPFPNFDPYGILTTVVSNAILSIVCWEIIYRVKLKWMVSKNKQTVE